jgi:hypothetical protein
MSRRAGFVCYTAPPAILQSHALVIDSMSAVAGLSSYHPLAESNPQVGWRYDGELQLIPDFDDDVSAAIVARREVLGDAPRLLGSAEDRQAIYCRKDETFARLRAARTT